MRPAIEFRTMLITDERLKTDWAPIERKEVADILRHWHNTDAIITRFVEKYTTCYCIEPGQGVEYYLTLRTDSSQPVNAYWAEVKAQAEDRDDYLASKA